MPLPSVQYTHSSVQVRPPFSCFQGSLSREPNVLDHVYQEQTFTSFNFLKLKIFDLILFVVLFPEQMVSLKDSLELERAQAEKLKEIQLKHAMERLGALAGSIKMKDIQVLTANLIKLMRFFLLRMTRIF